ncbi:DUF1980 domain-containing protein [Paenibacillus humicola]|uniref:DUF1980 domain-containing protein n=1 Tax=Paenibacillus humicola TaxID=3110540 RepID=UPI00237AA388|nr:DUF1980 domain-containing protein [Paenibacillus humicola]
MPIEQKRLLRHHLLRAAIMAGFALFIVHLARTEALALYVEAGMAVCVKLSAAGLCVTSAYQLAAALRVLAGRLPYDCECDHGPSGSLLKDTLIYALFLLPLALAFLLPD